MSFPLRKTLRFVGTTPSFCSRSRLNSARRLAATASGAGPLTIARAIRAVVFPTSTAHLFTPTQLRRQAGGCTNDPQLLSPLRRLWGWGTVWNTFPRWLIPSTTSAAMTEPVAPAAPHACALKSAVSSGRRLNITAASGPSKNRPWPRWSQALVRSARSLLMGGITRRLRRRRRRRRRPQGDAATVTT